MAINFGPKQPANPVRFPPKPQEKSAASVKTTERVIKKLPKIIKPLETNETPVIAEPPKRGRPKTAAPKIAVTIRLDRDIVENLTTLSDWRAQANDMLRKALGI